MAALVSNPGVAGYLKADEQANASLRSEQSAFLSELPGIAFAALTLVWVVASFAQLF